MSFYEKYLKYKNKYLSLKNQTGGGEKELLAEISLITSNINSTSRGDFDKLLTLHQQLLPKVRELTFINNSYAPVILKVEKAIENLMIQIRGGIEKLQLLEKDKLLNRSILEKTRFINSMSLSTQEDVANKRRRMTEVLRLYDQLIQLGLPFSSSNSTPRDKLEEEFKIIDTILYMAMIYQSLAPGEKIDASGLAELTKKRNENKEILQKYFNKLISEKDIPKIIEFVKTLYASVERTNIMIEEVINTKKILLLMNNLQLEDFSLLKYLNSLGLSDYTHASIWDLLGHYYGTPTGINTINICLLDFLINEANSKGNSLINSRLNWTDANMLGLLESLQASPSSITNLAETITFLKLKGGKTTLVPETLSLKYPRSNYEQKKYLSFNLNQFGGGKKEELLAQTTDIYNMIRTSDNIVDKIFHYRRLLEIYKSLTILASAYSSNVSQIEGTISELELEKSKESELLRTKLDLSKQIVALQEQIRLKKELRESRLNLSMEDALQKKSITIEIIDLYDKLIKLDSSNPSYPILKDTQNRILSELSSGIEQEIKTQREIQAKLKSIEENKARFQQLISEGNINNLKEFIFTIYSANNNDDFRKILGGHPGRIVRLINDSQTDDFSLLTYLKEKSIEKFNIQSYWDWLVNIFELNTDEITINLCLLDFLILNGINVNTRDLKSGKILDILLSIKHPKLITNLQETIVYLRSKGATSRNDNKKKYLSFNNLNQFGGDLIEDTIRTLGEHLRDLPITINASKTKREQGRETNEEDSKIDRLDKLIIEKQIVLEAEYKRLILNWINDKNKVQLDDFIGKINKSIITDEYKKKIKDYRKVLRDEFDNLISNQNINNLIKFKENLSVFKNELVIEILDLNKILLLLNDLQTEDVRILELLLPLYPTNEVKHFAPLFTFYNQITTINICLLDYILKKMYSIFPSQKMKFYEKFFEIISTSENLIKITNSKETLEYLAKIKPE
jgi:hypothetical protein